MQKLKMLKKYLNDGLSLYMSYGHIQYRNIWIIDIL